MKSDAKTIPMEIEIQALFHQFQDIITNLPDTKNDIRVCLI